MQVLGESMAGISQHAKNSKLPEFGDAISAASKALCGLTEAAAQVGEATAPPNALGSLAAPLPCCQGLPCAAMPPTPPLGASHILSPARRLPT